VVVGVNSAFRTSGRGFFFPELLLPVRGLEDCVGCAVVVVRASILWAIDDDWFSTVSTKSQLLSITSGEKKRNPELQNSNENINLILQS
jgi:hypothetical protein